MDKKCVTVWALAALCSCAISGNSDVAGTSDSGVMDGSVDSGTRDSSSIVDSGASEYPDSSQDSGAREGGSRADSGAYIVDAGSRDVGSVKDSGPPPPLTGVFIGGCRIHPPTHAWNTDVSAAPLHPNAARVLAGMRPDKDLHADWGTFSEQYGIPYNVGTGASLAPFSITEYPDETDRGLCSNGRPFCFPVPTRGMKIESGGDTHLIYLDTSEAPDHCVLYEFWQAAPVEGGWNASCGAVHYLDGSRPRPTGWTSADASGLAILPGLVRFDEIMAGEIRHALRFTLRLTTNSYVAPATHAAGLSSIEYPPMGTRVRLRASFDSSRFSREAQVVLAAMKKYGMILTDNGSNWYVTGDMNDGWSKTASDGRSVRDSIQNAFSSTVGGDFEVLDSGPVTRY